MHSINHGHQINSAQKDQHQERQNSSQTDSSPANDKVQPEGPASGFVDFDGIKEAAPLYPLEPGLKRDGELGHEDEDLGINSDGTNPGTEYMPPLNDPDEV